jgi:N-acetylglucosaminyldiphosphoundecaprenol N-acetyl-beta-D-mannosaminyltransferase
VSDPPILNERSWPRRQLFGVQVDDVTLAEAVDTIDAWIEAGHSGQHTSVNAAKIVRLQDDAVLREAIDESEIVTADGQAVVWASRFLGAPLRERVTGIDLMAALVDRAAARGYRLYLLGARPEVVAAAEDALRSQFPHLEVIGARDGYWRAEEEAAVVAEIAAASPDLLFVALETPAKELFLRKYRETLGVPFVMGVGGAFDILAGRRRRAPRAWQRVGLEWLYRLVQDPRRMAGRYVVGNTKFLLLTLRFRISGG